MPDSRLEFDPSTAAYRESKAMRRDALQGLHSADAWRSIVAPLVLAVRSRLDGAGTLTSSAPPGELATELLDGWAAVVAGIQTAGGRRSSDSDAEEVLLAEVGRALAVELSDEPVLWRGLFEQDLPERLQQAFSDHLPVSSIRRHAGVVLAWTPPDAVDSAIEVFGRGHGVASIEEEVRDAREGKSVWAFAEVLRRLAGDATLVDHLHWSQVLMVRAGADLCYAWLASFVHPIPTAVALAAIRDPDVLQDVLVESVRDAARDELTAVLVALELVETWEAIEGRLAQHARRDWSTGGTVTQQQCEASLRGWIEGEFPQRLQRFGDAVVPGPLAFIAHELLRRTWINRPNLPSVRTTLRATLVRRLCSLDPVDDVVRILLVDQPTPAALLSCALALHDANVAQPAATLAAETVLRAYGESEGEILPRYATLDDDYLELTWLLGGALSRLADPAAAWRLLLSRARTRDVGWQVPEDEDRIPTKRRHLFIVGAMATEWLCRVSRRTEALALFDEVWEQAHRWARSLVGFGDHDPELAITPLVQIWARLLLVHPDDCDNLACAAVPRFDQVELLVSCVATFASNLERACPTGIGVALRSAVRERFEVLRITWERTGTARGEAKQRVVSVLEGMLSGPSSTRSI